MTPTRFVLLLVAMAWTGAAALWLYAWTLCGPAGRNRLAFGLPGLARRLYALLRADALLRRGRHVRRGAKDEAPTYDGAPVRGLSRRTEAERAAAYRAMREAAEAALAPISGAGLVAFTEELRGLTRADDPPVVPAAVAALREVVSLQAELAEIEADYRQRIDRAVELAIGGATVDLRPMMV